MQKVVFVVMQKRVTAAVHRQNSENCFTFNYQQTVVVPFNHHTDVSASSELMEYNVAAHGSIYSARPSTDINILICAAGMFATNDVTLTLCYTPIFSNAGPYPATV
jgi:hypothetical protein